MASRRGNGSGTIFKRNGRGAWIARWYGHDGKRHGQSTRTTDKAAALRILNKLVTDDALRRAGVIDPRLEAIGIQTHRPISEHLDDWRASLRAKGGTSKQTSQVSRRAEKLINDCGFTTLGEIDSTCTKSFMQELTDEGKTPRTVNGYRQAIGQFIRWALADGRLAADPLASVSMVKVVGQSVNRRPLDADELAWLFQVTEQAPGYRAMSGDDRAMLYRLATGTGFRANEIRSLTPASFDLEASPPVVTVEAGYSKRRKEDRQPIRQDLADLLTIWLKGRPKSTPVFKMPDKLPPMLHADMKRARDQWIRSTQDPAEQIRRSESDFLSHLASNGRVVDFHALRVTYITALIRSGANAKETQELARHSDPKLTLNVYTKLGIHDLAGALENMPSTDSSNPTGPQRLKATGTENSKASSGTSSSESGQNSATLGTTTIPIDGTPLGSGKLLYCNAQQHLETLQEPPQSKATSQTRTEDLRFTKPLLYQLS